MRRRTAWIAVGAIVAVAVTAAVVWMLAPSDDDPEERALQILQTLSDGDADAIGAEFPLLDETALDALSGAEARIADPEVIEVTTTAGGGADVAVAYSLDDERYEAVLRLREQNGRLSAGDEAFAAVAFDRPVTIGSLALEAGRDVLLVPAVYDAQAAPAEFLDGALRVAASAGAAQELAVPAELDDAAAALAQTQLDAHAASCAASDDAAPAACGIAIPWAADLAEASTIEYDIVQTPRIDLAVDSFTAGGGVLVATISGRGFDGEPKTIVYRTESWSMRGDVSFTTDDIVLSVW